MMFVKYKEIVVCCALFATCSVFEARMCTQLRDCMIELATAEWHFFYCDVISLPVAVNGCTKL